MPHAYGLNRDSLIYEPAMFAVATLDGLSRWTQTALGWVHTAWPALPPSSQEGRWENVVFHAGNGFRLVFVKETAFYDCEITGSGAEFSLVSIDRPTEHGVKLVTYGGSFFTPQTAGTQMIIRSTGSGVVDEFTVQGSSLVAGAGTATNILALPPPSIGIIRQVRVT